MGSMTIAIVVADSSNVTYTGKDSTSEGFM
jgi:hypothetical protein